MSVAAQRLRLLLFCLACAVLAAAAIGFAGSGHSPAAPAKPRVQPIASRAPQTAQEAVGLRTTLGRPAHRFLTAFCRYEVGELGPGVRRALRATATPSFATELLAAPPRRPPQSVPAAVPGTLRIAVASISPPRALISGSVSRAGRAEQFSFLFEPRNGDWLASGPGE